MSHPSYAKGYRDEIKTRSWLAKIGECVRSVGSKGADLVLTLADFSRWKVSCKKRARGKLTYRMIKVELEKHDICATSEDYDPFPMIHIYAPKFIEICARAEAQDAENIGC